MHGSSPSSEDVEASDRAHEQAAGKAPRAPPPDRRECRVLDRNPHVRTLLGRIDRGGLTWDDVADDILPVFERARPFTYEVEPPAHAVVPPGVTVGFGVDMGPAFLRVGAAHLADWPVDLTDLTERALHNLRRRARQARDYDLVGAGGRLPTVVFQSREGWASTAVLVPEAIERLFGPARRCSSPRRATSLSGCPSTSTRVRDLVGRGIRGGRPECPALEAFEWRDGTVVPAAAAGCGRGLSVSRAVRAWRTGRSLDALDDGLARPRGRGPAGRFPGHRPPAVLGRARRGSRARR